MQKILSATKAVSVAGLSMFRRLPGQLLQRNPFGGSIVPARIPTLRSRGRPCLPFPHPWNYREPLQILQSCHWNADSLDGDGRHSRYLDVPGFPPVLISRDPALIRAIAKESGDGEDQFERDTILASGIAKGAGYDMLLYVNGPAWRRQRKLAAAPFGKTSLFQPERFQEFEQTFRETVRERLKKLAELIQQSGANTHVALEPEIKPIMLELLSCNFFGAKVSFQQIADRYAPAIERVIERMVSDTVLKIGVAYRELPRIFPGVSEAREDYRIFNELVDLVLEGRHAGRGLWERFRSDAPDDALRSNLRLVLAGALEATTSFASWAISHLARNQEAQQRAFKEIQQAKSYTPEELEGATYFGRVLEETLRLTPPLYFLPRRAPSRIHVELPDGRDLVVPSGAYVLLDHWSANRHEDHWGVEATGYPAAAFAPERWEWLAERQRSSKDFLHFGFGHGPRVCPGKHLGQLEVALVVGAFVRLFRFSAASPENPAVAGISTKPADGALVKLELRDDAPVSDPRIFEAIRDSRSPDSERARE